METLSQQNADSVVPAAVEFTLPPLVDDDVEEVELVVVVALHNCMIVFLASCNAQAALLGASVQTVLIILRADKKHRRSTSTRESDNVRLVVVQFKPPNKNIRPVIGSKFML